MANEIIGKLPKNAVPIAQAAQWTANWRNNPQKGPWMEQNFFKAFLIPMVDITEAMAEIGIANIRTYLGLDEGNNIRLLIVGVDEMGNDMTDESQGQFVYHFSTPCPPTCAKNSVLNEDPVS